MDDARKERGKQEAARVGAGVPGRELEAYHRAPTLMGGAAAGSQGKVRVWAPSRWVVWWRAVLDSYTALATLVFTTAALGLTIAYFPLLLGVLHGWNLAILLLLATSLITFTARVIGLATVSWGALQRPCYITTDEVGLGITTRTGHRALKWHEILALRFSAEDRFAAESRVLKLRLERGDWIEADLRSYGAHDRRELVAMIASRAGLEGKHSLFVRPGWRVLPSGVAGGANAISSPAAEEPPALPEGDADSHSRYAVQSSESPAGIERREHSTQARAGERGNELAVPAGARKMARHAPTLMAAAVPGTQGQVRVWAPSRLAALCRAIAETYRWCWAAAWQLAALGWALTHLSRLASFEGAIIEFMLFCFGFSVPSTFWRMIRSNQYVWRAVRRPCYVTSDDAGLGIITEQGQSSLRWEELVAFRYLEESRTLQMKPEAGGWVEANLPGYWEGRRKELLTMIVERAALDGRFSSFVRPGYHLEGADGVVGDSLPEGCPGTAADEVMPEAETWRVLPAARADNLTDQPGR